MSKAICNTAYNLSATSSLVLLWAGRESYSHSNTQKYLDHIEKKMDKSLVKEFKSIWPFYDQVIKNRKYAIKKMAFNFLSKNDNAQVVILAAGLDPLSIEIASLFPKTKVFDVDMDNMEVKAQILKQIKDINSINCIVANITDIPMINKKLVFNSWSNKKRTLVIAEGISYYLSYEKFWKLIAFFKSPNKKNNLILEYLLPFDLVSKRLCDVPKKVFHKLTVDYNLSQITHYSQKTLNYYLAQIDGKIKTTMSLYDIEKKRFNKNSLFKQSNEGWIEVSDISI